ncbi:Golgi-localized GRIP domain-containing [Chlorella sorokiniana]|uniref:Golgi-localized GRIP domain-containing n=1 Tax=Chlorella sorokiniana TaxID=3076 RepID=A0A2P6TE63_CHLSO|nr:Golgi-localized GRIP domain-containing [Chlorella sorokiniana]|eukprot:PRW20931.1 Golgi-localized GRIP domain-containing [Chlorella sorokiniana]
MKSFRERLQQGLANASESTAKFKQQLQQAVQPAGDGVLAAVGGSGRRAELPPRSPSRTQQAAQPPSPQQQGPGQGQQQAQSSPQPQYLRLPVESAKKLRWFDRQDINMLMQLHLREKQELFEANAALRTVLRRQGVPDAQLEAEVKRINAQVDAMAAAEQGVNQVLVLAAQTEIEQLKEALDSTQHELQHMRRQRLQAASATALAQQATAASSSTQQQQQQQQAAERVALRLSFPDAASSSGSAPEQQVAVQIVVQPAEAAGGGHASSGLSSALAALAAAASSSGDASLDAQLLQQAAAALSQLSRAQGVPLPGLAASTPPTRAASLDASAATNAAAADGSASAAAAALQEQCTQLQLQLGRMQAELEQAQQDAAFARDAAERKQQEMRGRFAEAQQRQGELLRVAQDSRLDAEARCEAAERKLQVAEQRSARLDSESRDLKAELRRAHQETKRLESAAAAAEARAAAADSAVQRARGAAEADAKSLEVVGQLRGRIAELEAASQQQQRALATTRQQADSLESRLAATELAAARSAAEARELEEAAHERDALAVRLGMLEAKLDETRVERGQAESYRALAAQSEEKRARAEDELLTTARLASSLEARLAAAAAENEQLKLELQTAEARVVEAQQSVPRLVAERWAGAGYDRSSWPLAAQEEIENVEARLNALHGALKEAQSQLADAVAASQAHQRARASAERAAAAAEDAAGRQQRESEQRMQRAQAAASAAAVQVAEFRKALSGVERERDQLLAEKEQRDRAAREAAAVVASARRRGGDGGLAAERRSSLGSAASGALPSPSSWFGSGSEAPLPSPLPSVRQRDTLEATDVLYLKNVLLKFLDAHVSGRTQECEVLLPAVATLLRASPGEYRLLRDHLQRGAASWLPALPSLMGGTT